MRIFKSFKKSGFSLMELTLAVLIVAILFVATVPIINRQLEKSEEYSYYMAYRSIEKMAGQIVALGDEQENTTSMKIKTPFKDVLMAKIKHQNYIISNYFKGLKDRIAASEAFVFSKLFPKTMSGSTYSYYKRAFSFDNEDYDYTMVGYFYCKNYPKTTKTISGKSYTFVNALDINNLPDSITFKNRFKDQLYKDIIQVTKSDGTVENVKTYYTPYDFNCCSGYTLGAAACYEMDDNGNILKDSSGNDRIVTNNYTKDAVVEPFYSNKDGCPNGNTNKAKFINYFNNAIRVYNNHYENERWAINYCKRSDYSSGWCGYTHMGDDVGLPDAESSSSPDIISIYNRDGGEVRGEPFSAGDSGECVVYKKVTVDVADLATTTVSMDIVRPIYASNWCTQQKDASGKQIYYGMTNIGAPDSINCQPASGNIVSANNDKFAASPCSVEGQTMYAAYNSSTNSWYRVCTDKDFNEYTQQPCGENSIYTGGEKCSCVPGWLEDASGNCTIRGNCPAGTTKAPDGVTCVAFPPLVKAKRFCELIRDNWNYSSYSCNTFGDGVYYYVYNAALGNDTNHTYLSINSKPEAFKYITPNIVLSNGLRIWILGDKSASIPGLSYFPNDSSTAVTAKQNMCQKIPIWKPDEAICQSADPHGYFCKSDKNCFKLDDSSYASGTRTTQLEDARGCCSSIDNLDYMQRAKDAGVDERLYLQDPTVYAIGGFTIFVDINGTKGSSTLWEDIFPFYISSNGTVYPGYPINSEKELLKSSGVETGNSLYIGGNSDKQLPVDVYYYLPVETATGARREKKIAFANVSYARGVCSARKVSKYTPYCMNLGKKYKGKGLKKSGSTYTEVDLPEDYIAKDASTNSYNPCDYFNCYVSVKTKLKFF